MLMVLSYEDNTIWIQNSTKVFSPDHYGGFKWNSLDLIGELKAL